MTIGPTFEVEHVGTHYKMYKKLWSIDRSFILVGFMSYKPVKKPWLAVQTPPIL
jgi:hypothetical protein